MIFKSKRTKLQNIALIGIAISVFIAFILPENEHFMVYLRVYGLTAIIFLGIVYWTEIQRKHLILDPYKKNDYTSKGEEAIAYYFKKKGIIYKHTPERLMEKTLGPFLNPFSHINLHPDFFLPEFYIFFE